MASDKMKTKLLTAQKQTIAFCRPYFSIRKQLSLLLVMFITFVLYSLLSRNTGVLPLIRQGVEKFKTFSASNDNHNGFLDRLNLLKDDDPQLSVIPGNECTLEYINRLRLQQNHPCVIKIIQRRFLYAPAERNVPYRLDQPDVVEPSKGQAQLRKAKFGNETNGFFIECGALDGEVQSNTLNLERFHNWTGLLVDADQESFAKLLSRRRKAYALPVCLSLEPYPTEVKFNVYFAVGTIDDPNVVDPIKMNRHKGDLITVQCFPLYSILLAIEQTRIDFFSLDVEGFEMGILHTIPWHKVDIKTLTIEWHYVGQKNLTDFLGPLGYHVFANNDVQDHRDLLFAKNESIKTIS